MGRSMSKTSRKELLTTIRDRYLCSTKGDKGRILDEFTAVTGLHRKHAIRLLAGSKYEKEEGISLAGRRVYDEAVREAAIVVWEASDRICGKRLHAALPHLVESMERHGHLQLDSLVRERLLTASASTLDRLLKPIRSTAGSRRRRGRRKSLGRQVPVRTYNDWNKPPPGYLEIDLVAHCGGPLSGSFIHSLVVTDVCTGWTEAVPQLARDQGLVLAGLEAIRRQLPFPILGIDSDNDGAFINETLLAWTSQQGIEFTRSRAYRSNDQAYIEQKNGAVVRRFVGHHRYSGPLAGQMLVQLYQSLRLYVNYFQPSFKLVEKNREGSATVKRYSPPATPCDRLLLHEAVRDEIKEQLTQHRVGLDPVALLHSIREAQAALVAVSSPDHGEPAQQESLEQFLSQLPTLWQQGENRPTHTPRTRGPRHWRTRRDPFEGAWQDILGWLETEPDITARTILDRLCSHRPDRFSDTHLRTLQRGVKKWRGVMVRKLVYAGSDQSIPTLLSMPEDVRTSIVLLI